MQMRSNQPLHFWSFPDEWRRVVTDSDYERTAAAGYGAGNNYVGGYGGGYGGGGANTRSGYGGGDGYDRRGRDSGRHDERGGGAGGRRDDRYDGDRNRREDDRAKRSGFWRNRHRDRYATAGNLKAGENPHTPKSIASLVAPLIDRDGSVSAKKICQAAGTTTGEVARADGFRGHLHNEDTICLNYTCGYCPHPTCGGAQLHEAEYPRGFVGDMKKKIEPGVKAIMDGTYNEEPPNKRQRYGPRGDRR